MLNNAMSLWYRSVGDSPTYSLLSSPPKAELGDDYQLFLLEDGDGKPNAVVYPRTSAGEGAISKLTEVWLALLFAALTVVTTANANGIALFQFLVDPFLTEIKSEDITDAILPALAFWFTLGRYSPCM